MAELTTDTFERPEDLSDSDDPRVLYARSYLLNRLVIGGIGVLLPTLLFIVEWLFLKGQVSVRGSLSAYYHTPARDLFVAGLCVTGVMLLTYMAAQARTWDFWLSSLAGLAVVGVAFFPTTRTSLPEDAPACGSQPAPGGCTALQQAWGEGAVATVHYISAGVFILSLAAICFLFAHRERVHGPNPVRARTHQVCGILILAAVAWVVIGGLLDADLGFFTPLYLGEVVSVYAFGVSWLLKSWDLLESMVERIESMMRG